MAKGKNSNYNYKQERAALEKAKVEETFRQKEKKKITMINICSFAAMIIAIVMLILYRNGSFPWGDVVLLVVLCPIMWLQGIRYKASGNPKIANFCRIMAIADAAFLLYNLYYRFFQA